MSKGSKRNLWYKQGIKKSIKKAKKLTNRRLRRLKDLMQHSRYKKLGRDELWKYID